jgi:hypothetical protein
MSESRDNSLACRIIAPAIILGIGLIPALYGHKYARRSSAKAFGWIHRTGKVVGQVEEDAGMPGSSGNGTVFRAIFEHKDAQGNVWTAKQGAATGWRLYELGTEVELLVDPNDPGVAVVNSVFELWALPTLFFLLASPFVLLGSCRLVRGVLPRRGPEPAGEHGSIDHGLHTTVDAS